MKIRGGLLPAPSGERGIVPAFDWRGREVGKDVKLELFSRLPKRAHACEMPLTALLIHCDDTAN